MQRIRRPRRRSVNCQLWVQYFLEVPKVGCNCYVPESNLRYIERRTVSGFILNAVFASMRQREKVSRESEEGVTTSNRTAG